MHAQVTGNASGSRVLHINGIDLHVYVDGTGPCVLLLHGFPDNHTVWRHQIPALVNAGYRVIAPDTRGCGMSEAPRKTGAYEFDFLVSDTVAILDALGVDKVRLVGHDWGAAIGWQFCMRHPERVERYAALSVGHPTAYARAPMEQKFKSFYMLLFQLRGLAEWSIARSNWWALRKLASYEDEAAGWIAALSRPGRLSAAINYYRANFKHVFRSEWPSVSMPVMGVWSDGDHFLAEAQMTQSRAHVTAPFRYERVAGANHWLQLTAPEKLNPLLLDFLR